MALLKHAQRPVSKRRQQLTLHPANFQELFNDGEFQDIAEASTEDIAEASTEEFHMVKYRKIFAWVLEDAKRYKPSRPYRHPQGAVTWVRLP